MRRALLVLLLAAPPAAADEGELYLDLVLQPEVAWVVHPLSGATSPFEAAGTFTVAPRVGGLVRYGLFNQLAVGVGADVGVTPGLRAADVTLEGTKGDLFTATRVDVAVPFDVSWRLDSGFDISSVVDLQVGPMVAVWSGNALADPTNLDASGLPSRLPVDIADQWNVGAFARASTAFEWRLLDMIVLAAAPSLGASWAGTWSVHAGLVLRPALVFSPLPL